uniref:Uncharacterized protein n=1 Tax=Pararge aegeria TaxID=116150 RepID=S4PN44_9NEOP
MSGLGVFCGDLEVSVLGQRWVGLVREGFAASVLVLAPVFVRELGEGLKVVFLEPTPMRTQPQLMLKALKHFRGKIKMVDESFGGLPLVVGDEGRLTMVQEVVYGVDGRAEVCDGEVYVAKDGVVCGVG